MKSESAPFQSNPHKVERLWRGMDKLDPRQVAIWREMSPRRRLDLAFQAYHFALDTVRVTERQRHPDLTPEELAWRVIWRMHGGRVPTRSGLG